MEERDWDLSPRARRAVAVMALAAVVLAAGIGFSLWSNRAPATSGPPPPPTSRPTPISMDWRSPTAGWIIVHDSGGPESFLFRTTDGGAHWERQRSIDGPASVRFSDTRHGILQISSTRPTGTQLLRTSDSGRTWNGIPLPQVEPGLAPRAYYFDGDAGWVLALRYQPTAASWTALYGTTDGGATWQKLLDVRAGQPADQVITGDDDIVDMAFVPGGTGWLVGGTNAGGAGLFVTRDGGRTWARQALPPSVSGLGPGPTDHVQASAPKVTAGGAGVLPVYDRDTDQTWLYATTDGGATWSDPRVLPGGGGLRRPAFLDGTAGWTTTANLAWVTADSGRTWLPSAAPAGGWQLGSVTPVSRTAAWATAVQVSGRGAQGLSTWTLFRTSDAGAHWTRARLPGLG